MRVQADSATAEALVNRAEKLLQDRIHPDPYIGRPLLPPLSPPWGRALMQLLDTKLGAWNCHALALFVFSWSFPLLESFSRGKRQQPALLESFFRRMRRQRAQGSTVAKYWDTVVLDIFSR